jgi:hypothetical protein
VTIPVEKQREETSLVAAVVDVLDAGQRVVLDRIELALVEARAAARGALAGVALMVAGLGLLLVGWIAASAVGVMLLERYLTRAQALGVAALVNFAVGAGALLLARKAISSGVDTSKKHDGHTNGAVHEERIA